jgi:hypothetical protein
MVFFVKIRQKTIGDLLLNMMFVVENDRLKKRTEARKLLLWY